MDIANEKNLPDDPQSIHEVITEICNCNERISDVLTLAVSLRARLEQNKHTALIDEDLVGLLSQATTAASSLSAQLCELIETRNPAVVFGVYQEATAVTITYEQEFAEINKQAAPWATPLKVDEAVETKNDDDKYLNECLSLDSDVDEEKLFKARKRAKRFAASSEDICASAASSTAPKRPKPSNKDAIVPKPTPASKRRK
jgi:hypothetical protein